MKARLIREPLVPTPRRRPPGVEPGGWRPFDDTTAQVGLVGQVLCAPTYPLSDPRRVRGPGAYLIRYHGPHPDYQDLHDHALYAGMSIGDIGERLASHRDTITANPELALEDCSVASVRTAGPHLAALAEPLLIGAFDPLYNRAEYSGFGSRPQGGGRDDGDSTAYDRQYPGRPGRVQN